MLIGVAITDPSGTRVLTDDSPVGLREATCTVGVFLGHLRLLDWLSLRDRKPWFPEWPSFLRRLLRKFVQFLIPEAH